jgi:pyruvate formate lyase activating enzyme
MDKRKFIKQGILGSGALCCLPYITTGQLFKDKGRGETLSQKLTKGSREAMYYEVTPRGVKCMICPNECTLKLDEVSDCHNRINKNDKLYTMAYGNPCAIHIDPIEKKPLYHFLPGSRAFSIATAGCNLACLNCQNWTISQVSPTETRNYDLMPDQVVDESLDNRCQSIAYTYSEPLTFYEYTLDSARIAREKGIRNVIVSAGYINEEPLRNLAPYIDAANIDLKSFKESIYLKLNAGKLQPVLDTLKILLEENVWLEITNLVIPNWTDDFDMIREMCKWLHANGFQDCPLHFSRFHPMYKLTQLPPTPVATLDKAREIALQSGIRHVYIGNVPGTKANNTICPSCKRILVERRGYLITSNMIKDGKCSFCNEPISGVWS